MEFEDDEYSLATKTTNDVVLLAKEMTPIAIKTLTDICQSSASDSARVASANVLLAYGWGKPSQQVVMSGGTDNTITVINQYVEKGIIVDNRAEDTDSVSGFIEG